MHIITQESTIRRTQWLEAQRQCDRQRRQAKSAEEEYQRAAHRDAKRRCSQVRETTQRILVRLQYCTSRRK